MLGPIILVQLPASQRPKVYGTTKISQVQWLDEKPVISACVQMPLLQGFWVPEAGSKVFQTTLFCIDQQLPPFMAQGRDIGKLTKGALDRPLDQAAMPIP